MKEPIDVMGFPLRAKQKPNVPPARDQCSFCLKKSSKVEKLIVRPNGVQICNECLDVCEDILRDYEEHPQNAPSTKGLSDLACSFCLKSADKVQYLIAGPAVYICGDCAVLLRQEIE